MAAQKSDEMNVVNELVRRMNEDRRRIRFIEQNVDRLDNGISGLEETVLSQMADLKVGLDRINSKLTSIAERLNVMESDIDRHSKQISKSATKLELKQIENFIDLVNPVTSKFVTKDELERALDDALKSKI